MADYGESPDGVTDLKVDIMGDLETASLYADVLRYQKKAATLKKAFTASVSKFERGAEGGMPLYEVGVVDVVVRRPTVLGSLPAIPYIEYQVALTRRTDQKTAVVGKRYSDLFYFNHELHRREIIRKLDAPSFPEKKLFSEEWWTLQTLDPTSKFVRERREELHYYLKKLFIANSNLFSDSFVEDFFNLRCFDQIATTQDFLRAKMQGLLDGMPAAEEEEDDDGHAGQLEGPANRPATHHMRSSAGADPAAAARDARFGPASQEVPTPFPAAASSSSSSSAYPYGGFSSSSNLVDV